MRVKPIFFYIQMELHHELNYHDYRAILGRVEDKTLMQSIFHEFKPHIVFHAAAYKHVPLIEKNPGRRSRTILSEAKS